MATTTRRPLEIDIVTGNVFPVAVRGLPVNLPAGTTLGGASIDTGSVATWGTVIGTLANQTDLVAALALKQSLTGTLALGGFGSITGRIGSANLPLGIVVVKHTNGSEVAYTTIASAVTAGVSGETAIIGPGLYNESIRLKNGVNIHFQNGAQLINSTNGPAFYTDNTSGAVTCRITGQGVIQSSAVDEESDAFKLTQNGDSVYVEAREIYGYHTAAWVTPATGTGSIIIKADSVYSEIYDTLLGDNGSTIHATVRNIYMNGADEDSVMEMNGTSFGTIIADRAYHKTGGIMTLAGGSASTINLRIRSFEGTLSAGGNMDFEGTILSPSTSPPVVAFLAAGKTLRLRGKVAAGGATVAIEIQTGNAGTIILDHCYVVPDSSSNTFLATNAQGVTSYESITTRPIGANVTITGNLSLSGAIPTNWLGTSATTALAGNTAYQPLDSDLTLWAATTPPSSYAVGDLLYASAANTLSKLADVATGNVLLSGGVTTAPVFGKVTTSHTTGIAASGANSDITSLTGTTTNDSAASGKIGEVVSALVAIGSPVSLTTTVVANVTTISLTAGDWDVEALCSFTETTATVSARVGGISSASATLPTDGSEGYCGVQSTLTSEINSITLPKKRVSLSGTTTIYLAVKATFSAGSCGGFGYLIGRRIR